MKAKHKENLAEIKLKLAKKRETDKERTRDRQAGPEGHSRGDEPSGDEGAWLAFPDT